MKKSYIYALAALLICSSCVMEQEDLNENSGNKIYSEIRATICNQDSYATKTSMGALQGNIYPVLWTENDEIALIGSSKETYTITRGAGTTCASFAACISEEVGPYTGTSLYPAAYPADMAFVEDSGSGQLLVGSYLPQKQSYMEGTFAENVFPMAAVSTDALEYQFFNLCGVIQLNIYASRAGQTISALYLEGMNEEVITGGIGMKFDKTDGSVVVSSNDWEYGKALENYGTEGYTTAIIDFGGTPLALSTDTPAVIHIAVLPQTFSKGFKVRMVDGTNGGSFEIFSNEGLTVHRSQVKVMTDVTYEKPEPMEIANSYVISEDGYYIMPAYAMGNRVDVPLDTANRNLDAALLWTDIIKPGDKAGSGNYAITNIEQMNVGGISMIQFKVNKDPATGEPFRGNAAIALYDEDTKEILWSWHLWLTETPADVVTGGYCAGGKYEGAYPNGETFEYVAEKSGNGKNAALCIMDRNLGAISADPADGVKTYGLYYQAGRKDPFIGSSYKGDQNHYYDDKHPELTTTTKYTGDTDEVILNVYENETSAFSDVDSDTPSFSTNTWYNSELTGNWTINHGFIEFTYAIQHPLTMGSGYAFDYDPDQKGGVTFNNQWTNYLFEDNMSYMCTLKENNDEWIIVTESEHGKTGLKSDGHEAYWNRTKTIMDPCPVSYSVLGERDAHFFGSDTFTPYLSADGIAGLYSQLAGYDRVWWPAAGYRSSKGIMGDIGYYGPYFFYDHINASHGAHGMLFHINSSGTITWDLADSTDGQVMTNHACLVRCVRAKQFGGGN